MNANAQTPTHFLGGYRPFWAVRFGVAPFLPMSRPEMDALGWDSCDVIIVTGDAYVDHPGFGMAVIGRVLESQGFRVGIIAQPDWHSAEAFKVLGRPNLFWGVTAGNMDSMINRYTAHRKIRSDDAYTPGNVAGRRPDRAAIVYSQRCREAFGDVPIILGGIEASLRRVAHYDYWSNKVRRSVVVDAKCDLLLYGNAERAIVEIAHRLGRREPVRQITDVRGTAFVRRSDDAGRLDWCEIDLSSVDQHPEVCCKPAPSPPCHRTVIRLPSYEQVKSDPVLYAHASRVLHQETNPGNARALVQAHGTGASIKEVWVNPPPIALTTAEMDGVFDLPYARSPHPAYADADGCYDGVTKIPAWEMMRLSVNILRGCFGGCTFCSITLHEGRTIQSRSERSILREIADISTRVTGFTGVISDLGGPTANMYRMGCRIASVAASCRKPSCLYPTICHHLNTDHQPLIHLYRSARSAPGITKILIGSGVRYDLATLSIDYVRELVQHHVGGYLKVAPEHTQPGPLGMMMKPGIDSYDGFRVLFDRFSSEVGKKQFLIPYFIAAHPGTTNMDMLHLALWLKQNGIKPDQVQTFYPSPMTLATTMYHSHITPLHRVLPDSPQMEIVQGDRQRRLHKAFLRYFDPANWPQLRAALQGMGRTDLIGPGKHQLVPAR